MPLFASACAEDPCSALCTSVAVDLDGCLDDWGVTWEELGAESRRDWRVRCQSDWDTVRADLEARELPAADDQCADASDDLDAMMGADGGGCASLRALYLR